MKTMEEMQELVENFGSAKFNCGAATGDRYIQSLGRSVAAEHKLFAAIDALIKDARRYNYLRDDDYYVTLRQRLDLARNDSADVFISIHADAFKEHTAQGVSVFTLSEGGASSEAAYCGRCKTGPGSC